MGDDSSKGAVPAKTMVENKIVQKQVTTTQTISAQKPAQSQFSTSMQEATKPVVSVSTTIAPAKVITAPVQPITKTIITTQKTTSFPIPQKRTEERQLLTIGMEKKETKPTEVQKPVAKMEGGMTQLEPVVKETRLFNMKNIVIAFVIGVILVTIFFVVIFIPSFNFSTSGVTNLAFALVTIYAIILFFLLEPKILREVSRTTVKTVEKPVMKEVIVEKPVVRTVEKPVVKETVKEVYVERPVTKPVMIERPITITRTVTKPVIRYIERPRKKLEIPRYEYVGSSEAKTYHTRYCRLGKLIKRKYAVHANTQAFFRKRKYKPCEVCILKHKKI